MIRYISNQFEFLAFCLHNYSSKADSSFYLIASQRTWTGSNLQLLSLLDEKVISQSSKFWANIISNRFNRNLRSTCNILIAIDAFILMYLQLMQFALYYLTLDGLGELSLSTAQCFFRIMISAIMALELSSMMPFVIAIDRFIRTFFPLWFVWTVPKTIHSFGGWNELKWTQPKNELTNSLKI